VTRRARRWLSLAALAGLVVFTLGRSEDPPRPSGAWMARAGVEPRFVEAGGVRVRYVRRGAGPPLVLVHGIASSVYSWAEVIPALAETHDVIAFDLPGFGGSDIPPPPFSADRYPNVLGSLLDALGLDRVRLVGHSLGGAVASAFAAAAPGRVERLVLIDSAGYNLAPADRPWLLRVAGAPGVAGLLEKLPVRRRFLTLGLRQVFHDDARVTPERVEEYAAPLFRPGAAGFMGRLLRGASALGLPEAIGRIRAPTLVVWGDQDTWAPLADADRFVAAIPGARKAVIAGCGHIPQEERPQELVGLLTEFLRPTGSSR
jgi:pimeloyl-ACP methyl ester carboxylesterase